MEAKSTPGPWHVMIGGFTKRRRPDIATVYATDSDLRYIAKCDDVAISGDVPTDNIANARLIAAAPEMLAMLKACEQVLRVEAAMMHPASANPYRDVADSIDALIARIDGTEGGGK